MGKRSNGEGTIYKRADGRWCGSCYKSVNGKMKRVSVYGKTQKEVKAKLKDLQERQEDVIEEKEVVDVTLGAWMQEWLITYKKSRIKESTYANYKQIIETHIVQNNIGSIGLCELTTEDLQRYYDEKRKSITHLKKPLSPRMLNYIAVLVNGALGQAVLLNMIEKNPNRGVILPRKERREIDPLTEQEVKLLLENAKGTKLYLPLLLEIYTGMRRGELLGLCWRNVDLEKGLIYVRTSLARVPMEDGEKASELKLLTPKTNKSVRTIPLVPIIVQELCKQKEQQKQLKESNADVWQDNDLVFCRDNGYFLDPRDFLADFQKLLKKAGIRKIRFHDMRHTFASMLLNEGEELKVIQELLGHTTITTTADIYAHLKTEKKMEAVSKIGKVLK